MKHGEEHVRALLTLPAEDRARAAKLLLDSLDENALDLAEGTDTGSHTESEIADELAELEEIASDKEELRAAVRAAVQVELEPLHELTKLLQRFAELARTTGQILSTRTA